MRILVFNAGSSSLKFDVRDVDTAATTSRLGGSFTDFAAGMARFAWRAGGQAGEEHVPAADLGEAAKLLLARLSDPTPLGLEPAAPIDVVAHRVVHGGEQFVSPTLLDHAALEALEALSPIAPLHNPPALAVIHAARNALGEALPEVAVFDTTYYAQLPPAARHYAVPAEWPQRYGVRRYGFHGIAHRYLCEAVTRRSSRGPAPPRIISLQLGRGCSVTASRGVRAIDTSMGFTPLEGLVMGTRSGDIDAGAVLHVMQQARLSPAAMSEILNEKSGLAGLSGRSGDMRELLALGAGPPGPDDPRARLAIDAFCRRARHYVGAFLAELGGADVIVFGGGIGENCAPIRAAIVGGLAWAGIELDAAANAAATASNGAAALHAAHSRAEIRVIAVDEAALIAGDAAALLAPRRVGRR